MPLSNIQLRTLEKSISHWDRICQGIEVSNGGLDCACCCEFTGCIECPIMAIYGNDCRELGYHKYAKLGLKHGTSTIFRAIPELREKMPLYLWNELIELAEAILIRLLRILPPCHKWADQARIPILDEQNYRL